MTFIPIIVDEAESFLRGRAADLARPKDGECLLCYVGRLLDDMPCDGKLTHALRYRDLVAPRASALATRLGRVGGYCDCEIFMNGYRLVGTRADPDEFADPYDGDSYDGDPWDAAEVDEARQIAATADAAAEPLPPCQGVRRGVVQPCANWERIRRW